VLNFAGNRRWVYAQKIRGHFRSLRHRTSIILQLILFVTPWLRLNGHPALMVDLPARRVYALGAMYTARDTVLLLLILLFLAFALFFFTSLFGRLWCGFACPQTVFLEEWIRPLEHWIEGSRGLQMKRDKGPWNLDRVWRKSAKWSLYAIAAVVVSMTLGSYFEEAPILWTGHASSEMYWIVAIFAAIWFLDFAWFREQFCNYLCPYARFQSALTDDESLLLVYETGRGEPRGGDDAAMAGRCIECDKCVAVCPQGIDIRNGFQLECIACGACIDACDEVLGHLGHEGLIRYDSVAKQQGKKVRLLRPRTLAYGGLLGGLAVAATAVLMARAPFESTVARAPGSLFTVDADGWLRNTYLMRITNNDPAKTEMPYTVTIEGLEGAQVTVPDIRLGSAESRTFPLVIRVPPGDDLPRAVPFHVRVNGPDGSLVINATFQTEAGEDDSHD
jgi:cytochrome c oxidase accessory protein FixG